MEKHTWHRFLKSFWAMVKNNSSFGAYETPALWTIFSLIQIHDLSSNEVEKVNFAFQIYDLDGSGTVDAFYLGDLLRAVDLNPTNATIEKMGGTKKKDEKKFTVEEVLPIYSQVKKDKDQGVYEDFIECLKLYDKQEDGHMLGGELTHILLSLGEKLTDAEVDEVTKDCLDEEDEDGMIPYVPFVKRFMVKLKDMI